MQSQGDTGTQEHQAITCNKKCHNTTWIICSNYTLESGYCTCNQADIFGHFEIIAPINRHIHLKTQNPHEQNCVFFPDGAPTAQQFHEGPALYRQPHSYLLKQGIKTYKNYCIPKLNTTKMPWEPQTCRGYTTNLKAIDVNTFCWPHLPSLKYMTQNSSLSIVNLFWPKVSTWLASWLLPERG